MSVGILVCSKCQRVVHQDRDLDDGTHGWSHCGDRSEMCSGAKVEYPVGKIKGVWCGVDLGIGLGHAEKPDGEIKMSPLPTDIVTVTIGPLKGRQYFRNYLGMMERVRRGTRKERSDT